MSRSHDRVSSPRTRAADIFLRPVPGRRGGGGERRSHGSSTSDSYPARDNELETYGRACSLMISSSWRV